MTQAPSIHEAQWQGVTLRITWDPQWSQACEAAHLQVESVSPERAPLPITETGYRSHFTSREIVEAYGGPVALVLTWLDQESRSPIWAAKQISRQQYQLL